jgi:hypothetical protein
VTAIDDFHDGEAARKERIPSWIKIAFGWLLELLKEDAIPKAGAQCEGSFVRSVAAVIFPMEKQRQREPVLCFQFLSSLSTVAHDTPPLGMNGAL